MFVPLHVISHYSLGLGVTSVTSLVQHAGRLGYGQLALTDVENVYGQVHFHAACRAHGIQPITGMELRPAPGRGRLVLIASTPAAYADLCRIVTQRRAGTRPTPRTPESLESLGALDAGVFLLTDDPALLTSAVELHGPSRVRALLVRPGALATERELSRAAGALGIKPVASLGVLLIEPGQHELQRLMRAIRQGRPMATLPAAGVLRLLLSPEAAEATFADCPEAVRESRAIADACVLDLLRLPSAVRPEQPELHHALVRRVERELRQHARARAAPRVYDERLSAELAVLETLRLSECFASVAALVDTARASGVRVAARGSAVSSLVGHLLGFSPVDPVEHGLYFERFASSARRSPPDIDLDVGSRGREALLDEFIRARGADRTARVSALQTWQRRSAYRAGLRALGASPSVIENFLKRLPPEELWPDAARAPRDAVPLAFRDGLALIERSIGMPRHLALHPGGVLLAPAPLGSLLPLERSVGGACASQYDAASLARVGLLKIDLLGNHCLDEIEETLRLRAERSARGEAPPLALAATGGPAFEDAGTLQRIDRAQTLGCYQIESPALRAVLARLPVRRLEDVLQALAVVRPGPASGRAKQLFLARARGEASEPALHPLLAERLRSTHGLLLFEEDILYLLSELAGLPLATAEALRVQLLERGDDVAWLGRVRHRFLQRCGERAVPREASARAWSEVLRFVRYSFNRAHAASQATLAYQTAFLACHAPLEHGCALLNHHGGLYPRRVIAADLVRRGIPLRPPSLQRSRLPCGVEADDALPSGAAIRLGLALIKGLRSATRQRIIEHAALVPSLEEWLARVRPAASELRALLRSGACDELFGLERADYPWVHEAVLEQLERRGAGSPSKALRGAVDAARRQLPREPADALARYRALRRIRDELRYLELWVTDHPMHVLRAEADRLGCVPSHRLAEHAGERVLFAGVIAATRRVPVRDSAVTQFMTLEDEHGLVEARLAPAGYRRLHARIGTPGPFLVRARAIERQGALYLGIDELLPFHERPHGA